jgi:hypothetical protein
VTIEVPRDSPKKLDAKSQQQVTQPQNRQLQEFEEDAEWANMEVDMLKKVMSEKQNKL